MLSAFETFKPRKALPRMLVDFLLVHLCMVIALATCVLFHTAIGEGALASIITRIVWGYYFGAFLSLSLLFPLTFWTNGFYSSIVQTNMQKAAMVARGVGLSVLIFLTANYLVFRLYLVPRSVVLTFCVLVITSLTLVRVAKAIVVERYDINPKTAARSAGPGTVLVVGGAGYLGSILVRQLLEQGRRVRVLDNLMYGDQPIADLHGNPNFELIVGDCRNIQSVVSAVKGVEAIVDLAAIVGDPACEEDRQIALEINFAATRMMIEIAKGNGVSRFLFASSCSVYGATDLLMDEQSEVTPISLYAQTKVDSERVLLKSRTPHFHPTVLRLATVFGNSYRPRFDLVVNLLVARAHQDGVITIFNSGQWRPFIHARDVAAGILQVLQAPLDAVSGEVFNLGDTTMNHTLAGLAEQIREAFPGTQVELVENADRRNYRVSFAKIERAIGFRCAVTLAHGIAELKAAFESGRIPNYADIRYHNQKFLRSAGSPISKDTTDARVMAAFAFDEGAR